MTLANHLHTHCKIFSMGLAFHSFLLVLYLMLVVATPDVHGHVYLQLNLHGFPPSARRQHKTKFHSTSNIYREERGDYSTIQAIICVSLKIVWDRFGDDTISSKRNTSSCCSREVDAAVIFHIPAPQCCTFHWVAGHLLMTMSSSRGPPHGRHGQGREGRLTMSDQVVQHLAIFLSYMFFLATAIKVCVRHLSNTVFIF